MTRTMIQPSSSLNGELGNENDEKRESFDIHHILPWSEERYHRLSPCTAPHLMVVCG